MQIPSSKQKQISEKGEFKAVLHYILANYSLVLSLGDVDQDIALKLFSLAKQESSKTIELDIASGIIVDICKELAIKDSQEDKGDNDPHRTKSGNKLPKTPKKREKAIQSEIKRTKALDKDQADHILEALENAQILARSDSEIVHSLSAIASIEIRAGPMPNLYGVMRQNILYLDQTLLNDASRIELLITLIHEAGVALGRSDEENERFAQECVGNDRSRRDLGKFSDEEMIAEIEKARVIYEQREAQDIAQGKRKKPRPWIRSRLIETDPTLFQYIDQTSFLEHVPRLRETFSSLSLSFV